MDASYVKLDFEMPDLTPEMKEVARVQLNETNEVQTKALEELKNLIKKEKKLVVPMDEDFLIQYLRSRKYDVKRSFKVLQKFWAFRRSYKHIFDAVDPDKVKDLMMRHFIGFLPHRDKNGCAILVFKVGRWNTSIDSYNELFQALTAILIVCNKYPPTQVCGYRVICDFRELSWDQMKMATPHNILVLIHSTQYCFPARYKGFHMISENKLFNSLWMIVYPLLSHKMKQRMTLHGSDLEPLKQYIHPSVLPKEYGGEGPTFDNTIWKGLIEDHTDSVMSLLKYGYKD